jgi:peptide methionine sulfoxide reductase msrA/msrB
MKKQIIIMFTFLASLLNLQSCGQNKTETTNPKSNKMTNEFPIQKTEEQWKEQLSDDQYYILREKGTERPYTGKFLMHKEKGNYTCAACGNVLFASDAKFDSHCGWPSFDKEIQKGNIKEVTDNTLGMKRTEIMCGKCGGHLGHVFDDGPTATGIRYCVNSVSIGFEAATDSTKNNATATTNNIQEITLGAGCFWCVEAVFLKLQGVISVESGYMGGKTLKPTYREVCSGTTNHAEVVHIKYDASITNLDEILKVFFTVHNPTTLNRQGADAGTQYRSAIFYSNAQQEQTAKDIIAALTTAKAYDDPIVTSLEKESTFYKAEDYHQNYYNQNKSEPYCQMVIQPKIEKFEKVFKERLKK